MCNAYPLCMSAQEDFDRLKYENVLLSDRIRYMERALLAALAWEHLTHVNFKTVCEEVTRNRLALGNCLAELTQARQRIHRQASVINQDGSIPPGE